MAETIEFKHLHSNEIAMNLILVPLIEYNFISFHQEILISTSLNLYTL